MSRRWPIVGRSGEVDGVLELLRQAATGGGTRGVVLHGPAGIGKTSVARQLTDAAIEAGFVTEWLTAPGTTGAPLMWLAPLRQPVSTVRSRSDLLHELEQVIRERSPNSPLFTVIDDAPGLDESDLDLLAHLARRNLVFVVATARGSSSRPAIFRPMLVDGTFDAIEVMPLSDAEVIDAIETYLGGPLEPAAARAIATATGGVGLFAREYVVANVASGALAADSGRWRSPPRPACHPP